jgi:dUTP pyrophosphatase
MVLRYKTTLRFKKVNPEAYDPVLGYEDDLGIDLKTPIDLVIDPNSSITVDTGIAIEVPKAPEKLREFFNVGCFVKSKSGLSVKHDIEHGAGVIDPGYTGNLVIKLYNYSNLVFTASAGDKIAQITFPLCLKVAALQEVEELRSDTERGTKGFGSTG